MPRRPYVDPRPYASAPGLLSHKKGRKYGRYEEELPLSIERFGRSQNMIDLDMIELETHALLKDCTVLQVFMHTLTKGQSLHLFHFRLHIYLRPHSRFTSRFLSVCLPMCVLLPFKERYSFHMPPDCSETHQL